jgi:hypothetical protein
MHFLTFLVIPVNETVLHDLFWRGMGLVGKPTSTVREFGPLKRPVTPSCDTQFKKNTIHVIPNLISN